ncbi:biotin carboxyl carrier protein [Clostridium sp. CAG:81]|nr:biotin carboxyl carrier protein [Clostridium sp. CAG:81]
MKYVATLNGKKYEVEIERVDEYRPLDRGAQASAPAPILAAAPAPKAAPAPAAAPAAPAGAAGAVAVTAPMPGKILGVKASAGQAVKRGQVLLILEAMKILTSKLKLVTQLVTVSV